MKKQSKRKSRPIVVGHLEKVSSKVFEDYPEQITGLTEGTQGVYALYRRQKLYYIGLASDLKRRIKWHLKDKHKGKWDRFRLYIIRKKERIGMLGDGKGKAARKKVKKRRKKAKGKKGERPLRGLLRDWQRIYATYKGKDYKAKVLHSGSIKFGGKLYRTPTGAASVIVKRGGVDGWYFWKYKNDKGEIVALADLRK